MTNRHVLELLVVRGDSKLKLRVDAVAFLFVQTKLEDTHFKNTGVRSIPIRAFDLQEEKVKEMQAS